MGDEHKQCLNYIGNLSLVAVLRRSEIYNLKTQIDPQQVTARRENIISNVLTHHLSSITPVMVFIRRGAGRQVVLVHTAKGARRVSLRELRPGR